MRFGQTGDGAALQAAVATANSTPEDDTLELAAGCTYTAGAALAVTAGGGTLIINGHGATLKGIVAHCVDTLLWFM